MEMSIEELEGVLNATASGLSNVTSKKMFGCHALWASENVFAMVWKHGRIGLKLPEQGTYNSLMNLPGSEPWKAGSMKMAHWVLVPETFHGNPAALKKWLVHAHEQCTGLEKPKKKKKAAGARTRVKKKR